MASRLKFVTALLILGAVVSSASSQEAKQSVSDTDRVRISVKNSARDFDSFEVSLALLQDCIQFDTKIERPSDGVLSAALSKYARSLSEARESLVLTTTDLLLGSNEADSRRSPVRMSALVSAGGDFQRALVESIDRLAAESLADSGDNVAVESARRELRRRLFGSWLSQDDQSLADPLGANMNVEALVKDGLSNELRLLGDAIATTPGARDALEQAVTERNAVVDTNVSIVQEWLGKWFLLGASMSSANESWAFKARRERRRAERRWCIGNERLIEACSALALTYGCQRSSVDRWRLRGLRQAFPSIVPQDLPTERLAAIAGLMGVDTDKALLEELADRHRAEALAVCNAVLEDFRAQWDEMEAAVMLRAGVGLSDDVLARCGEFEESQTQFAHAIAGRMQSRVLRAAFLMQPIPNVFPMDLKARMTGPPRVDKSR